MIYLFLYLFILFLVILLHHQAEMLSAMELFPRAGTSTEILESRSAKVSEEFKVVTSSAMHVDRAHFKHVF